MARGRPTKALNLTPQEKEKLAMLARRPKSSQAIAMRARIVLACAEGVENKMVASRQRVTQQTLEVARPIRRASAGRTAGRASAWRAAND